MGSCKTSVSACPLSSPSLWGKLQNLVRFATLTSPCLWGKLQNRVLSSPCLWGKLQIVLASPCLWGKLQNIVLASPCLWGSCNLRLCLSSGVAVSLGKATKPRWFWCADVAVSMGEACSTQYYSERLCASFVVHSSTRKCFVQAVWYTVVLERVCTTKLAQSTSQYYCVLQSLHKALPSTTVYYKACTKHFPALLCTTKLAQTRSNTTVYHTACTKHFPVLLCTTKLARTRSSTTVCKLCSTQ